MLPTEIFGCSIPQCKIQEDHETATAVETIPNQTVETIPNQLVEVRITKLNVQGEAHSG